MSRPTNPMPGLSTWLRKSLRAVSPSQPLTLDPRQVRLILVLFFANALILGAMAFLLFQAFSGRPLTIVIRQAVTPGPVLPTRAPPATPPAAPTPIPTPFGGGGTVAFVLRREGSSNIYAINLGDKRLVRLTWAIEGDRDPAFSPDGQELAFASRRDGSWGVYRMELETGITTRLTFTSSYSAGPAWSPDGKWIAFESYRAGNMDIYVMDRDGKNVSRFTVDPAPDTAPAWSPDGRYIAFASYRTGNKDIFLRSLDTGEEINLTNSPDRDEDSPAWSHDGTKLAYTSSRLGDIAIYVNTFDWQQRSIEESHVELFGQGKSPAWSADDNSLGFVYNRDDQDVLIVASLGGWGLAQQAFGGREFLDHPTWSPVLLSEAAISRFAAQAPPKAPPLYAEIVGSPLTSTPPFTLVVLPDYGNQRFLMSDAVDDSFKALRVRTKQETGYDYLGRLADTWRPMDHVPRPGQSHRSWHVAGRAFDLNPDYTQDNLHTMEIIREDIGYTTYWRVYLKAMKQDGTQGEPLKEAPWQMVTGSDAGAEGGRLKSIPPGYYVDFTTLAADYGWNRVQAIYRWRYFFPDAEYWHFQKDTGLSWWEAMEQIFSESEIVGFYGPYPGRD